MIKKRIISSLTFNDGILYRTKKFIPDYRYTINFIDSWEVDEIIALDITRDNIFPNKNFIDILHKLSSKCFVPLSVGGKIRTFNDAKYLFNNGADKIVLNTGAFDDIRLIDNIANKYGVQSIILSVDYKETKLGKEVFVDNGTRSTNILVLDWIQQILLNCEIGEILLTSIDHDGSLEGADLDFIKVVSNEVNLPILIRGGIGNWKHFYDGFMLTDAAAICTQNIYHLTENSILSAKKYLKSKKIDIR
jgi:cyclase